MSALGQKQTCAAHNVMSALPPKADMCSALPHVRFGPIADIQSASYRFSDEHGSAGQNYPDFGELARLSVDLDCARMLLDDDVVADGEAEAGAFSRRLGREERIEHLFFNVRGDTGAVIADPDFHAITKVFGRSRESRLVVVAVCIRSALGRCIKAV